MNRKLLILGGFLSILLLATVGVLFLFEASPASAAGSILEALNLQDDDDRQEQPITGEALDKASAAALAATGGGRVTDTEVGDEEGYYEVEVTLADGGQVDVHLDRDFNVLGQEPDGEIDDD